MAQVHRSITKEEYDVLVEKDRKPEHGKSVVDTPAEDTKLVEELLGLPEGSFGESFITVGADLKACPGCGRQTSFLDIVSDGTAFHGNEFVKDVFQGKRGIVYNPNPPRPHKCFKCGLSSPVMVTSYAGAGYTCSQA